MQKTGDDRVPTLLRSRPSWLVTQLATQVTRLVGEAFDAAGYRRYHYALLAALHEFGPASQAALARRCRIDRSYVVEAVGELATAGFVLRAPDPADRRRNIVTLTADGHTHLAAMTKVLDEVQHELTAGLPAAERDQFTRQLQRVLDHLRESTRPVRAADSRDLDQPDGSR
ncbi:MarR family winged helix-turn-helix transcriptional regulator [Amycolatopsis rhabdoformis]|uniref:MarR family winged helix-turn-helix transcriptional regulator n=1 Tax=Amycolatopsis rhabdoformis TaxID=1448059 RepID=A0ABZ1IGE7_9PSEU|nr:MarR family winged helix-turn-helix transcriptional regulator [Amycolatopsis rhabdoformis]WSE33002.1 MarR family winged helix-turn-helix transcriptional regulator [Amycolatopsis rhabdoformis]